MHLLSWLLMSSVKHWFRNVDDVTSKVMMLLMMFNAIEV